MHVYGAQAKMGLDAGLFMQNNDELGKLSMRMVSLTPEQLP